MSRRRGALEAQLRPDEQAIRDRFDAERRAYQLERDLARATTEEEKAQILARFAEAEKERLFMRNLAQREADELAGIDKRRRDLENDFAQEALEREIERLRTARDERIQTANDALAENTANYIAAAEAESERLREEYGVRLGDLRDQLVEKIPDLTGEADETITTFLQGVESLIADMARDAIEDAGRVQRSIADVISGAKAATAAINAIPSAPAPFLGLPSTPLQGFATGGVVGGPMGSPQLVLAHGGETILPTHQGGGYMGGTTIVVNVAGSVVAQQQLVESMRQGLNHANRINGREAVL
jgi:hypothetical protein